MKAYEILERDGWCQKWHNLDGDDVGPCSLIGAICRAYSSKLDRLWSFTAICLLLNCELNNLINWNDAPGRTATEVIALLKKLNI